MAQTPGQLPLFAGLWRGRDAPPRTMPAISTGLPALDAALPYGGWPLGALTEILVDREGIGELRLVMPALAQLSRQGRWLAWISPPYIPYAPALAHHGVDITRVMLVRPKADNDHFWAVEQALRAGTCGAVLAWPRSGDSRRLRRLQLAAEAGNSWGLLFRPLRSAKQSSPAALRLQLLVNADYLQVTLLKCRGGWPHKPVNIKLSLASLTAASAPLVSEHEANENAR